MGNVNAAIKHIQRGIALRLVAETEATGASVQLTEIFLKQSGYVLEKHEIMGIYRYLEGKGLIKLSGTDSSNIHISRVIAKITPKGTDVLDGTVKIDGIELEH